MDWTKAKNILIVALIATNLVLLFTYAFQEKSLYETEDTIWADTIALLETKNIFVKVENPKRHSRMPVLTVEYGTMDQELVDQVMSNQERLPADRRSEKDLLAMAESFLRHCDLLTENVVYESLEEKKGGETLITYSNQRNGLRIEDSWISCTIKDGKVTKLERDWLDPVGLGKMKREIIPAATALLIFMGENEEIEKIDVEDISLVYYLDPSSIDTEFAVSDTAFPTWKITYNQGKTKHIMAYEQ